MGSESQWHKWYGRSNWLNGNDISCAAISPPRWLHATLCPRSLKTAQALGLEVPRRYLLSVNSASMDGNGAGARSFFCGLFCGALASTLDDGSVGFSTRRDDPSN